MTMAMMTMTTTVIVTMTENKPILAVFQLHISWFLAIFNDHLHLVSFHRWHCVKRDIRYSSTFSCLLASFPTYCNENTLQ